MKNSTHKKTIKPKKRAIKTKAEKSTGTRKAGKKTKKITTKTKSRNKRERSVIESYKKWIFYAIITIIIIFLIVLFFVVRLESTLPYTKVIITNTTIIGNVIRSIL